MGAESRVEPEPESVWESRDGDWKIRVDSFDGAYAVVTDLIGMRAGKQRLVQPDHFGETYLPVEMPTLASSDYEGFPPYGD
jgi:hypothetical protein